MPDQPFRAHHFEYTRKVMPDRTIYSIDVDKSHYFGIPWRQLGDYGRRKFENALVMSYPKDHITFVYNV